MAQVTPRLDKLDSPRCGICHTQTNEHGRICSAAGIPRYSATPFSEKEDEIGEIFGW
jgi:hypothetical protein